MTVTNRPKGYSAAGVYELNDDIDQGFDTAVMNSQTTLALQYLRLIMIRDQEKIRKLEEALEGVTATQTPSRKTTSSAKKEE